MNIRERLDEKRKAWKQAEADVRSLLAKHPGASRQKITATLRAQWRQKYGESPFLQLLEFVLPLLLKLIFGI